MDDSFDDDDWWDSLAIDQQIDSQLQAVERDAKPGSSAAPQDGASGIEQGGLGRAAVTAVKPEQKDETSDELYAQLKELRELQRQQKAQIEELTRLNQQQKGEISVVRSNWNKVQTQNRDLLARQGEMESDYRQRLERVHQENQRHFEKLETAAAFRRIEQDTNRTAWPSTLRRRPPVLIKDPGSARRDAQMRNMTPTPSYGAQHGLSPSSSQDQSPLMTRHKRKHPFSDDDATSPSDSRRTAARKNAWTKPEFPNFINSFVQGASPAPSGSGTLRLSRATGGTAIDKTPAPASQRSFTAATAANSRESTPESETEEADASLRESDAVTLALNLLFRYRIRWVTHVMCHSAWPSSAPVQVPGTAYFPLGPGVRRWSDVLEETGAEALELPADASAKGMESIPFAATHAPGAPSSNAYLLHLTQLQLPPLVPAMLKRRLSLALSKLWETVLHGSSYSAFLAECGHYVDERLRDALARCADSSENENAPPLLRTTVDETVAALWEQQSESLYGNVAASLRTILGIFLRLNLMHHVRNMLIWMTSLGVTHPGFTSILLRKSRLLPWTYQELDPASAGSSRGKERRSTLEGSGPDPAVPSSSPPEITAGAPPASTPGSGSPATPSQSRSRSLLPTPTQLIPMLIECVRKSHAVPLVASCPEALPEQGQDVDRGTDACGASTPLDIGAPARTELVAAVLRLVEVLAWTTAPTGFHEYVRGRIEESGLTSCSLRALFQAPGILVAFLGADAPLPWLRAGVRLLTLVSADPYTLHTCLVSGFDRALQPDVSARQHEAPFPILDLLAHHLRRCAEAASAPASSDHNEVATQSHPLYRHVVLLLSRAALHHDTAILLAESVPLLASLVHSLALDTDQVWNRVQLDAPSTIHAERYVCTQRDSLLTRCRALERVCFNVRLLHQLYAGDRAANSLAQKLASREVRTVSNGIFHAYVVSMCRIAFASEPPWVEKAGTKLHNQLESVAVLAADLVDLVLAPNETDEIFELFGEEGES